MLTFSNYMTLKRITDIKNVFPSQDNPSFTFIDLFAGIGGFRMAMQNLGGKCVFSSEIDENARRTYAANYGEIPDGDITLQETKDRIPEGFDILCGGFPCQAFSLQGKRMGFNETRGTLFFDVADVLRQRQPKAFFLENVKGLLSHDRGKTFKTIINTLDEVGYDVVPTEVVDAANFGVPQHRERVYIIGYRKDLNVDVDQFRYPKPTDDTKRFRDVMEEEPVHPKYYMSKSYLETLERHKSRNSANGNGFGYAVVPLDGVANTILATGGSGRERNLVRDPRQTDLRCDECRKKGGFNDQHIRVMTPREWARLQGFPDTFRIIVPDGPAYKQFGNSVAVPAIQETAKELLRVLDIRREYEDMTVIF